MPFLRPRMHRLSLDRSLILEIQPVMVSWVFDVSNVDLPGHQQGLMWNERAQIVLPGLLWNIFSKITAQENHIMSYHLLITQWLKLPHQWT